MTSAEHVIENLIYGMKRGRECSDILQDKCNEYNLEDCYMSEDEAVAIACHVVWGLYGKFPECGLCDNKCEACKEREEQTVVVIETCPKCGHDLVDICVCTYPPVPKKECWNCGWSWEGKAADVVRVPFKEREGIINDGKL